MKKLIILALLVVSLAAQAYEPLIREDRVWEYYSYDDFWGTITHSLSQYQFDETQVINGKTYHQLKLKGMVSWQETSQTSETQTVDSVAALLREEDGVVYMLVQTPIIKIYDTENRSFVQQIPEENQEVVIYDFTQIQPGDYFYASGNPYHGNQTVELQYHCPMITKYCVVEVTDDAGRNKITLRNCAVSEVCESLGWNYPEETWGETYADVNIIEGIGNIGAGSFLIPETEGRGAFPNGCSGDIRFNNLYDLDGNVVYKGANVQKPSSGIESIGADAKTPGKLYDLTGREIRNPQRGTIYIQDGEKHIAR